jgi:hypothetical protein
MRSPVCFTSWAVASALALSSAVAVAEEPVRPYPACEKTATEGDVAAAKGAFEAGNASFNEADYDRAINYWEDAYRRDCTAHRLLLNLARAYELNGQKHHAVSSLETFLARSPGSSEESQIKRRIEKLNEQIQAEAAPPPGPAPVATQQPAAAQQPQPAESAPAPASSGGKKSITPLIVAGAGGVVTIVGGILWLGAKSDVSKYEEQCPNRECPPDQPNLASDANSARTRENVWGAVTLVGLGTAIGGTVWYFVQKPTGGDTATRFSPVIGHGYGGIDVAGHF